MKSMALDKQMELFDEGGLLQEGGSVDEESGNDVPVGSLKEEVRDDIPAQLSEGEFVMPADVVRFHGLDKMMALRDEAKMGLQRMDDMGQMGNSEEAIIPDGIPFGIDDLELEDEPMEMQVGGFVQPQTGMQYTTPSTFQNYAQTPIQPFQPQQPVYGQGVQGGYQPQFFGGQQQQPTFEAPKFDTLMPKYVTYVNSETKAEIQVPVDASGNPLIPIPAGFVPKSSLPTEEEKKPETPTTVTQTPAVQQDSSGDSMTPSGPTLDRFGREEDPRISQVTSTKEFSDLAKKVDPRGVIEKITDGFMSAIGTSTTSKEYQKALDELSVGVANYTDDPEEQKTLLADITGKIGTITRTAAGQPLAPVLSGAEADKFLKDKIESARVQTATVTGDKEKTVTEAAKTEYKGIGTDPVTGDIITPLDGSTAAGILEVGSPEQMFAELSKENPSLPVARALADLRAQASGQYSNYDEDDVQFAKSALDYFEKEGRIPKEDTPVVSARKTTTRTPTGMSPGAMGGRINVDEGKVDPGLAAAAARATARDEETAGHQARYESQGYSPSAAASAARNKTAADERAREETGRPDAKAVTDSSGKAVTSGGKAVISGGDVNNAGGDGGTDSRVICTELYKQGKLSRDLYRMDVVYTARELPDTLVRGYHYWAIPMVPVIRKNKLVCDIFEYLTLKRAEEIAHIVDPITYPKSTFTGRLIKTVGEAVCYGIGKFVKQKDYSVLYNGKSV